MQLSDTDIQKALKDRAIQVEPEVPKVNIRPTGIRVHLADTIAYPKNEGGEVELSALDSSQFEKQKIGDDGFLLKRRQFILASTRERLRTASDLVAHLDGRSTVARVGLMIHCGSSVIDNIHDEMRAVTLEIVNLGPYDVRLRAGDAVGMLFFTSLHKPISQAASIQYRGQVEVMAPTWREAS